MENPTIKSQEAMKNRHLTIPPHQAEGIDLPSGGLTGQALIKKSDADDDVTWGSVQAPLPEGTEGQVLRQGSSGLEFATVGSAAYKDYTANVEPDNHNLVESNAVYAAISSAISAVYEPHGDITCAELTSDMLVPANVGNLYTVSDSGTTSNLFVQGAGKTINAGDSVAVIVAGPNVYKFNLMPGIVDLSSLQTKALSPAIPVEGVNQATVVDCLTALATALASHTTYFNDATRTNDILADAVNCTRPTIFNGNGSGYTGVVPSEAFKFGFFLVVPRGSDINVLAVMGNSGIATCRYSNSVWSGWNTLGYGNWKEIPSADFSNMVIAGTGTATVTLPALANAKEIYMFSSFGGVIHIPDVSIARSSSEASISWWSSGDPAFTGAYDKFGTMTYIKATQTLTVTISKSETSAAAYSWALEKIYYR